MNNFSIEDLNDFQKRGVDQTQIEKQLDNFKTGFDFVELIAPATTQNGLISIPSNEESKLLDIYDRYAAQAKILKMVPASGSASRMFKSLFTFRDSQNTEDPALVDFMEHLSDFPFYGQLKQKMAKDGIPLQEPTLKSQYHDILDYILSEKGLNYGGTPKGLVDFHSYSDAIRTAFDEHLAEGAQYCKDKNGQVNLHFTVSDEHQERFKLHYSEVQKAFEKRFGVQYHVTFSIQKPSTDTVSMNANGEIVRDEKGKVLFRPGGHGALIHNLNDLYADIIFIKNIDNVVPDYRKADTIKYKKILAGTLLKFQGEIFDYLKQLDKPNITDEQLAAIEEFAEGKIGYKHLSTEACGEKTARIARLKEMLNRPIRVCGMVKNEGEPGGGPFWVKAQDGDARLMIIESAQINGNDSVQKAIAGKATHFNPVDLVCATRNYKGEKFDLNKFIDYRQGFITNKSYHGTDIHVQELPGLWNGAMANWITLFVEVPLTTFSPVKTVFDLRRPEHQNKQS